MNEFEVKLFLFTRLVLGFLFIQFILQQCIKIYIVFTSKTKIFIPLPS